MARKKPKTKVPAEQIERSIHIVRGQRVMLDADLAQLYDVTTAAFNQAVKRNAERFPMISRFSLRSKSSQH
jgi:hypothetical protein